MYRQETIYLKCFFESLKQKNIKYGVLRNYEEIMKGNFNDIDICIEKKYLKYIEGVVEECNKSLGWSTHLTIEKDGLKAIHIYTFINNELKIIHFDFFENINWRGIELLRNESILKDTTIYEGIFIVNKNIENVICLISRLIYHGYVKEEYKTSIHKTCNNNTKFNEVLNSVVGDKIGNKISYYIVKNDWKSIENLQFEIRKYTKFKSKKNIYKICKYYIKSLKKVFTPRGLSVVFLGCDGSGKSTIINAVKDDFRRSFSKNDIKYFHWRPNLLIPIRNIKSKKQENNDTKQITDPHQKKPYSKTLSLFKFLYYFTDYILGNIFKVYPAKIKSKFIIFDRYYYDYFIDLKRYRMDLNINIISFLNKFVSKPDITFILIGNPEKIQERKKEITIEETKKQINMLIKFKKEFNNYVIVDVNKPIDDVVYSVNKNILDYLKGRN